MDHILTRCKAVRRREIWDSTKQLCRAEDIHCKKPNLGDILESTLAEFKDNEGNTLSGRSRFYKMVLIPRAAYMIWIARYQRVIPDNKTGKLQGPISKEELRNQFAKSLNEAIRLDMALGTKK